MKSIRNFAVLTLFLTFLSQLSKAFSSSKSSYSSVKLRRPAGRSDWHHQQFQKLHLASLEPGAQTNFGYWCGPTIGGYCGSMNFDDINTAVVTHVPFAFASIATDGIVSYEYDQGSVQQYNSSILINQGVMAGLSLGGSGTDANNCLNNIDNCVTSLGKTLEYYENVGSPFYFVDSDFEKPENEAQMQNLITFWLTFNAQFPGYLITMAPECAYLWCGAANWPYNSYVPVVNQLGPYGANIIYKINAQSYNNWCSNSAAGTAQFFEDVATTWIEACPSTGYLGLENQADIFGLGVLAANKDGDGYAAPAVVTEALQSIDKAYGTSNGMFWDTLTDLENGWIISNGIAAAAPEVSFAPTIEATAVPTAPTQQPTEVPTHPTAEPTVAPTAPTQQPTPQPTVDNGKQSETFLDSAAGIGTIVAAGFVGTALLGAAGFFVYKGRVAQQNNADTAEVSQPLVNNA